VFEGLTGQEIVGFFAYFHLFTGGVYVTAGDLNGDERADIITGAGAGGGPHVRAFNADSLNEITSFFAYHPAFTGGVIVGTGDFNGDGKLDIQTAAGPGGGPHVRGIDPRTGEELVSFFAYEPTFTGGVSIVGSPVGPIDSALRLAASGLEPSGARRLTQAQLDLGLATAVAQWQAAGLAPAAISQLSRVAVHLADLPGNFLGLAFADSVWIDFDAAGYGWRTGVDSPVNPRQLASAQHASEVEDALGQADLPSVLAHELGHLLGLGDLDADHHPDLMSAEIPLGIRRLPTSAHVDSIFGAWPSP
jgi:hypothetical protein